MMSEASVRQMRQVAQPLQVIPFFSGVLARTSCRPLSVVLVSCMHFYFDRFMRRARPVASTEQTAVYVQPHSNPHFMPVLSDSTGMRHRQDLRLEFLLFSLVVSDLPELPMLK